MTLELKNVSLHDGVEQLVLDLNAKFETGMNILLGPTLAGKTTTMRLIAGLMKPDEGEITLNGQDLSKVEVRNRSVAFVYQQFINYPSFSVFDNIASPLRVAKDKMSKSEIKDRVEEVAELLGLAPFLQRKPSALSGGQQQRVAIARALSRKSDVVLLDEPLANLDYKLREQLREELQNIFSDSDSVVIYSTAEPAESMYFSVPTFVMHEGQIIQRGSALDIYQAPESIFSAKAVSDPPINLLSAKHEDDSLSLAGVVFKRAEIQDALAHASEFTLGIQPHDLHQEKIPNAVEITGVVQLAEVTGSSTFVHVRLKSNEDLVVELDGAHPMNPGIEYTIYFDPARIYAFDNQTKKTLGFPERLVANG